MMPLLYLAAALLVPAAALALFLAAATVGRRADQNGDQP